MAEHLARTDKLDIHRKMRFGDQFIDDITALVSMITKDVVDRYIKVRLSIDFYVKLV